uniref:Weissellicin Y n=1 Tax=Weissella hellenica TaxID=46256 RepID=H1A8I1_WEIHE|nr:weissellicin Y [Weissella hellenica]
MANIVLRVGSVAYNYAPKIFKWIGEGVSYNQIIKWGHNKGWW